MRQAINAAEILKKFKEPETERIETAQKYWGRRDSSYQRCIPLGKKEFLLS